MEARECLGRRFGDPLEYSKSSDLRMIFKGNLIQPCKEKWLTLMERYAPWRERRFKICSAYTIPATNKSIGTPAAGKWFCLFIRPAFQSYIQFLTFLLLHFPFFPFFISSPLSLRTFLEHILLALALTNTLSHRLRKEKKRIGVGVVEWGV